MKNKRTWENKGQKVASKQKKTQNSLKSHKLVKKVKKKNVVNQKQMSQAGEKMSQSSKKRVTKSDKLVKNCHKIVKKKS